MTKIAPAVVIGADLNGLGVVRSLARGGVPTIVIATTRWRAANWSRFCRSVVLDRLYGRSLIDGLLAAQRKLDGRPVLILTDEIAVNTVSENRDELLSAYKFHLPPRDVVAMLQNKARFHEFAEQQDLPVPRTIIVKPDTPLAKLATLRFPVIVKPAEGRFSDFGGTIHSHYVVTPREAENLCRRLLESVRELVVQEWIDGPDSNICFSLFYLGDKPESLKVFTGRKLSSHPAKIGNVALCLAAPEVMDSLEPQIAKFLELTAFRGLGSLKFKWDVQQRRYFIIGQTVGRTDWQEEIATLSGVNLPLAAYRDEVGRPPIRSTQIDRTVAWRESALLGAELAILSPGTRVYDGHWRLSDPIPGLIYYTRAALKRVHRQVVQPIIASHTTKRLQISLELKFRNVLKPIFKNNSPGASN